MDRITAGRSPGFSLEYAGILFDYLPLVMARYTRLLLLPSDFSIQYSWPSVAVALTSAELWTSRLTLLALLAITALLAWKRRDLLL